MVAAVSVQLRLKQNRSGSFDSSSDPELGQHIDVRVFEHAGEISRDVYGVDLRCSEMVESLASEGRVTI